MNEYNDMEEMDDDEIPQKQPAKLVLGILTGAVAFAGLAFFLHNFSTDYVYEKEEAQYLDCLKMMAAEDYPGALDSVDLLLREEEDSLAYLGLKNTICEKSGDNKLQKETLQKLSVWMPTIIRHMKNCWRCTWKRKTSRVLKNWQPMRQILRSQPCLENIW
ncbi:hypothetical protein C823_001984 [Eubacterium plexicaudatum ASF492]|nr:hypothetical protein C823_001984 [Eubacterium plexicaudatum ASF492]